MKKSIVITLVVIILSGVILYGVHGLFFERSPEKLLKLNFNICLKDFKYNVETFEEQWCPNGDGSALIIYKFDKLTQENIDYLKGFGLKSLPISNEEYRLMEFNEIPREYFYVNTGYYIYKPLSNNDLRDYKVFVLDIEKQIAILYFQYM